MRVIYDPPVERRPQRPFVSAAGYRLGTVVEMDDGSRWEVVWDNQDRQHRWTLYTQGT